MAILQKIFKDETLPRPWGTGNPPTLRAGDKWAGAGIVENICRFLKALDTEKPHFPAISLLGLELKNIRIWNMRTAIFRAALFTIAKTQLQLKCPSIFSIGKMKSNWFIYTLESIWPSKKKSKKKNTIGSNMAGLRDDHTKWSQRKINA